MATCTTGHCGTGQIAPPLHVVGLRRDGAYETFTMFQVPEGQGLDNALAACEIRDIKFIYCSREKGYRYYANH